MTKADPQAFTKVAERLGIDLSACLFIDDKTDNINHARQAGMHVIPFNVRNFDTPDQAALWLRHQFIQRGLLI